MSHLLQMRGLKLTRTQEFFRNATSHLLQMRGLKPGRSPKSLREDKVASFTDAWIETPVQPVVQIW